MTLASRSPSAAVATRRVRSRAAPEDCNLRELGHAALVDTNGLRQVHTEGASDQLTEGAAITVYYEGKRPRLVLRESFGEMGRSETRYFIEDSANFIVEHVVTYYELPIMQQPNPTTWAQIRQTVVVCNGIPLMNDLRSLAKTARPSLDSLLRWAASH